MTPIKSTRIRFCLKTEIFSFGLAYCPHVSGENDHRKRIFSKTLSREEIFENACFLFTCGWTKTKVFEFVDVIHRTYIYIYIHRILPAFRMGAERDAIYFHRFSVFVWTGENESNTLSVDAYFGENGGGKCSF